jgi:hypothetical protein
MRRLTLFQNSIVDRLKGGNVARNRDQPSWLCTPDTPANCPSSSDLNDKVDALSSVQLLSFLVPSIDLGVIDSLDGVDVLIPDEGF